MEPEFACHCGAPGAEAVSVIQKGFARNDREDSIGLVGLLGLKALWYDKDGWEEFGQESQAEVSFRSKFSTTKPEELDCWFVFR